MCLWGRFVYARGKRRYVFMREVCCHPPTRSFERVYGLPAFVQMAKNVQLNTFKKMINRYRSAKTAVAAFSVSDMSKAKTNLSAIGVLSANRQIDAYELIEEDDVNKEYAAAVVDLRKALAEAVVKSVVIKPTKLDNGKITNNATIETEKAGKLFANVYGVKDAPLDKTFAGNELKTLKFAYCKSGNEIVTKPKTNPFTGELENIPTIYVCL